MMMVVVVKPTGLVVIVGLGGTRGYGDKKNGQDGRNKVFLNEFHCT